MESAKGKLTQAMVWMVIASFGVVNNYATLLVKSSNSEIATIESTLSTERTAKSAKSSPKKKIRGSVTSNRVGKHSDPKLGIRDSKENRKEKRCVLLPPGGCFTDCLSRSIPPEIVAQCADSCANLQIATCATCLGVGIIVVISCWNACGESIEVPPEP